MQKYPEDQMPSPEVIEQDIAAINAIVDAFAAEMKATMTSKAREGRYGWNDPTRRDAIYNDMLAHAIVAEKMPGKEVHIANYAMMLHLFRTGGAK